MRILAACTLLAILSAVSGCGSGGGTGCGSNPQFGLFCCPTCPEFVPKTCDELTASQFDWGLAGFSASDILNPDVRYQQELTAVMHVGESKALRVTAGTTATADDCRAKAVSVDWSTSNPVVARLDVERPRRAVLVALQPGDTVATAILQFEDGTPATRVFPWSFTNVGIGDVTVVRVIP